MIDFGGKLREAREARGISLREIAASTKISVAALEALERNDVSKLPGGIFTRSFVRGYASAVGLNPDDTVREFLERFGSEPPPEPVVVAQISDEETRFEARRQAAMLTVRVAVVVIIAAVLLGYFIYRGRRASATLNPAAETTASSSTPASPPAVAAPGPSPTHADPAAAAAQTPAAAAATGPMRLELHPTAPCWVSVVVDGQKVFAGLLQGGERRTLTVKEAAVIDVGDAAAFAFSVDGRPAKPLGGAGEVKTARITRDTLPQYLR